MSEKDKITIGKNLKHLRKLKKLTQQELADKLGIRRSSIGAYEECRAAPKYDTLQSVSDFFQVSIDMLVKRDLTNLKLEDLNNPATRGDADWEGRNLRVLSITVDEKGKENIQLVHQKASAGYLNGLADPEFIEELPYFQLPMLGVGTFRAFEIKGDSMLPLRPGTVVIGEYVENMLDLKDGRTYIVVSENEGVVYKRVFQDTDNEGEPILKLHSDNPAYPVYHIPMTDVRELWRARMYMSNEFPDPEISLDRLSSIVMEIQQEMIRIKRNN